MALGEAFVNVRADLKPFAKDLEKGLKAILQAAERKIVADGSTGKGIRAALTKQTADGISDGMSDGSKRGRKNAEKEFLSLGQKFFAALADFVDDGLSAIPAKVKAGILIGIIGAGVVAAPFIAGLISSAIIGGVAVGVLSMGAAIAAQQQAVRDRFTRLGQSIMDSLRQDAGLFVEELLRAANVIQQSFNASRKSIQSILNASARFIVPLTRGLTGFVQGIVRGVDNLVSRAGPIIEVLRVGLPRLGEDIGQALAILGSGSADAAIVLRDFLFILGEIIKNTAATIRGLSELYFYMRLIGQLHNLPEFFRLLAEHQNGVADIAPEVAGRVEDVNGALHGLNSEALAARLSVSALLAEFMKGVDGAIQYEAAIDDLAKSIREGNRDFDIRSEKGRENFRLVQQAIAGAAAQRDAEILRAAETGRSIESINAAYDSQIAQIEKTIGKYGAQSAELQKLIDKAREVPEEVQMEVTTPGLQAALRGMRELAAAAVKAGLAGAEAIRKAQSGEAGLRTASQPKGYAGGGIAEQPTNALIAEAGYAEAVIPDPAVMPDRAMELSNKFGLTSLIASSLGALQPVVNVFIGAERLDQRVDYRIGLNNQMQALSMAQGVR